MVRRKNRDRQNKMGVNAHVWTLRREDAPGAFSGEAAGPG